MPLSTTFSVGTPSLPVSKAALAHKRRQARTSRPVLTDYLENTIIEKDVRDDWWNEGNTPHETRFINAQTIKAQLVGTEATPPNAVLNTAEAHKLLHRGSTAQQRVILPRPKFIGKVGVLRTPVLSSPKPVPSGREPVVVATKNKLRNKLSRPRTGKPVVDGLTGVESNPGPKKVINIKRKIKTKKGLALKIGGRRTLSTAMNYGGYNVERVSNPTSTGMHSSKKNNHFSFMGKGQATVLGSPAHIFTGRCAVQNIASGPANSLTFIDGAGNLSPFMYLNPRICCQNSAYSVPQGNCPIGVIAQPFRKYSFRKLKLHYEPTATSTTLSFFVAAMFDPEVIATSSLPATQMAFANFEASAYGPVWAPWTLDLTKWLDRSKWYFGETPSAMSTSLIAGQSVQGTVQLCANNAPAASTIYGLLIMEFELALSELGPTEVFTAPAFKAEVLLSKDECKDEVPDSPAVMVEENPLTRSIHIPQSYLRSLLGESKEKHA